MSVPGHATPDGTAAFLDHLRSRHGDRAVRTLGRTGLHAAALGFGTYRCHPDVDEHPAALKAALAGGLNLIDTSANYMDGGAEVLIGDVLNQAVVWEDTPREGLIVVSKAGYIQGENMSIARDREDAGDPFPEVVKIEDGLWHCIHPEFLADQITRTLARMHLDVLDVYLLHNPEYFFSAPDAGDGGEREKTFYDRLRRAFIALEKMVDEGLIRWYGVSSNGFPLPLSAETHVDLERVWRAYGDACLQLGRNPDEGHFAVIQLPFNWIEHQALVPAEGTAVLEIARKHHLAVLANRPLNAIDGNRLRRLASYDPAGEAPALGEALKGLSVAEDRVLEAIRSHGIDVPYRDARLSDLFRLTPQLQEIAERSDDIGWGREMAAGYLGPWVETGRIRAVEEADRVGASEVRPLLMDHQSAFRNALDALLGLLDARNRATLASLVDRFDERHPELAERPLSQKALRVALDTPGIDVVLNGMRRPPYVADGLEALAVGEAVDVRALLG